MCADSDDIGDAVTVMVVSLTSLFGRLLCQFLRADGVFGLTSAVLFPIYFIDLRISCQ